MAQWVEKVKLVLKIYSKNKSILYFNNTTINANDFKS